MMGSVESIAGPGENVDPHFWQPETNEVTLLVAPEPIVYPELEMPKGPAFFPPVVEGFLIETKGEVPDNTRAVIAAKTAALLADIRVHPDVAQLCHRGSSEVIERDPLKRAANHEAARALAAGLKYSAELTLESAFPGFDPVRRVHPSTLHTDPDAIPRQAPPSQVEIPDPTAHLIETQRSRYENTSGAANDDAVGIRIGMAPRGSRHGTLTHVHSRQRAA